MLESYIQAHATDVISTKYLGVTQSLPCLDRQEQLFVSKYMCNNLAIFTKDFDQSYPHLVDYYAEGYAKFLVQIIVQSLRLHKEQRKAPLDTYALCVTCIGELVQPYLSQHVEQRLLAAKMYLPTDPWSYIQRLSFRVSELAKDYCINQELPPNSNYLLAAIQRDVQKVKNYVDANPNLEYLYAHFYDHYSEIQLDLNYLQTRSEMISKRLARFRLARSTHN